MFIFKNKNKIRRKYNGGGIVDTIAKIFSNQVVKNVASTTATKLAEKGVERGTDLVLKKIFSKKPKKEDAITRLLRQNNIKVKY